MLLSKTYTGSSGKLLRSGNAIQVWVKTSPNVGNAKVKLIVNSLNGTTLNKTLQAAGNNLDSFDAATFEGQNLNAGFTLQGTVTLTFTGTIPYGSRLNFAVTAGNTPCSTQQQKQLGYIYSDHLDTPRLITNGPGQALWRWDSDPFGATQANENPQNLGNFNFNLRFPGQYYDKETKTHYNYFRDYDPSIGRYLQSDPIGLQGGVNTYSYVSGDPISRSDPSGLKWGSSEFVSHFYFGKGKAVDLASIGLLSDFTNSASVKQGAAGINTKLQSQAQSVGASLRNSCTCSLNVVTKSFSLNDSYLYNVTGGSPANRLWSIGRGTAFVSANCFAYFDCYTKKGRWSCNVGNRVRDSFAQPLDIPSYSIHIRGNVGGTPYGINADWTSSLSGTF